MREWRWSWWGTEERQEPMLQLTENDVTRRFVIQEFPEGSAADLPMEFIVEALNQAEKMDDWAHRGGPMSPGAETARKAIDALRKSGYMQDGHTRAWGQDE